MPRLADLRGPIGRAGRIIGTVGKLAIHYKKGDEVSNYLHARQPVNAYGAACGITPELDELLDGEDASQVFD